LLQLDPLSLLAADAILQVSPIFHMTMVLERSNKVELAPTIQSLFDMIHKVGTPGDASVQGRPNDADNAEQVLCCPACDTLMLLACLLAAEWLDLVTYNHAVITLGPFLATPQVSRNLITVIQAVPRLALQLTEKQVNPGSGAVDL
jgi:hypothetical protein